MVGFGFFLLVAILCGPGLMPMLVGVFLYDKFSSHHTGGGLAGLLILGSAFLTMPLTGGGIMLLTKYGHTSLAAAWAIIYLSAWLSYAAIIFSHRKEE